MPLHRRLLLICVLLAGITPSLHADEPIIRPDEGLPVVGWEEAGKHLHQHIVVQGLVYQSRNIGHITFLNFDDKRTFTIVIFEPCYKNFDTPPEVEYALKNVQVVGRVSQFEGRAQMQVCSPDQIRIVEKLAPASPAPKRKPRPFDGTVKIATYNVLNLFDTHDDPYHEDGGTRPKPRKDLEKLADSIRALDADVLALQEVENRGYLDRFVTAMIGDMGYEHTVLLEGNDHRGIDCAVLSRLPVGPVTSHRHLRFDEDDNGPMRFRRDLLRVRIMPPGAPEFDVFVVHLKSKRGGDPTTDRIRIAEARAARSVLDDVLRADPQARFVFCGDFNDTLNSPAVKAIIGDDAGALRHFVSELPEKTHTFNKDPHGMIDFILCSPGMAKHYAKGSIHVASGSVEKSGSDHNPVRMTFKLK